jgi:hypothetical protein
MVMAMYIQALDKNVKNPAILYTLAERMVEKGAKEGKMQDFESLQLYLMILRDQKKYKEGSELLNGVFGKLCKVESDLKRFQIEFDELQQNWDSSAERAKEILATNPDDWSSFETLIAAYKNAEWDPKDFLEYNESIKSVVLAEKNTKRGPFLSEYYFYAEVGLFDKLAKCMLEYVKRFGSTLSCFDDLYPKLSLLPSSSLPNLVTALTELLDKDLSTAISKIDQTRLNITVMKLCRYFNSVTNTLVDIKEQIKTLFEFYNQSLELSILM